MLPRRDSAPDADAKAAGGATHPRPLVRRLRAAFQLAVFALTLRGGIDLYRFVRAFESGATPGFAKPSSPEGFLPIGSFMSLKLWVTTGVFDRVHPAGLTIFATALLLSLLLKKGFCGWICPVGTLSEWLWKVREAAGGRMRRAPAWLDLPLRSLKYLLLAPFLWIVLVQMPAPAIGAWLQTDYWKVADLKMLEFFRHPSTLALGVLTALVALSLVTKNFWCRFLCPYGALLGLLSLASPVKIRREESRCTHCRRCSRHCPAHLPVDRLTTVRSPECFGCLGCVSRCPAPGALDPVAFRRRLPPAVYAAVVAALFWGIIAAAAVLGRWRSDVPPAEYQRLLPAVSRLVHP